MSAFSEKMLSIVYGIGFGVAFGSVAAGFFRSYLIGFIVGAVIFAVARRFWIHCSKHRNGGGFVYTNNQLSDGVTSTQMDSTPWYLDSSQSSLVGNVYHRSSENFSSNSTSCFDR